MFFVCTACGMPSSDRLVIDGAVVCECGHRRAWRLAPMFVITGASGSGKSTIAERLVATIRDPIMLDADILWAPEMNTPADGYARFRSTWMRLAANIAQSGHSTLLVGAGVPEQYESRPERKYLGPIYWLALVASPAVIEARLRARPAWRGIDDVMIETMLAYNGHLAERSDMARLDTSHGSIEETERAVAQWLKNAASDAPRSVP